MEKVQWNSIDKKQNGLNIQKNTDYPLSPGIYNNTQLPLSYNGWIIGVYVR